MSRWGGRRVTQLRQVMAAQLPTLCRRCGRLVTADMAWQIGHIVEADIAPHLMWDPGNHGIEHRYCNAAAGARYGNRKRSRRPRPAPTSRDW